MSPVLAQTTILDQIELKADPSTGNVAYVFEQDLTIVTSDGTEIARSFDRKTFPATDPRAVALLGQAAASALAQLQPVQVQLQEAQAEIVTLQAELADLRAQLAALAGQP